MRALGIVALAIGLSLPVDAYALDDGIYPLADDGVVVEMADGSTRTVSDQAIATSELYVFSIANDNESFQISWKLPAHPPIPWPVIVVDGVGHSPKSGGTSGDGTGSIGLHTTDETLARSVADRFGVELRLRKPLGDDLERAVVGPSEVPAGAPIPIAVRLKAETPIAVETGGRSRSMEGGSRDNRFTFEVTRDGDAVEGMFGDQNFGGLGSVIDLEAGGEFAFEADLADWFAEPLPAGSYEVTVRFELTLFAAGEPRGWDQSAITWEDEVVDTIRIEIEP